MNADLNVEFGGFSSGEKTARLGVKIDRSKMSLDDVDRFFGEAQLKCVLMAAAPDNGNGDQSELPGMPELPTLEIPVAEAKCFGTNRKYFRTALTVNISGVEISDLLRFAQQAGRLQVERIGDIPEKKRGRMRAKPAPAGATDDEGSTD